MSHPSLTIVFDNYPHHPDLAALWGFAAFVRLPRHNILFDTGSNGRVLLKNMSALGIDPRSVDLLFLSHPHWDHIGGLDSILELNPTVAVVVHQGFSEHLIQDLRGMCGKLIEVGSEPLELLPGVYSTGMLDSQPPEQAMVFESGDDAVVISGCAHPGMESIVRRAKGFVNKPVSWAIGGFHLMYQDAAEIERTINALQALGVTYVVPTHCSGDAAKAAFRSAYGARCIEGGAGREIRFSSATA